MDEMPGEPARSRFHKFLEAVGKLEASDLHLKADVTPRIRKSVDLMNTTGAALTHEEIEAMLAASLPAEKWREYQQIGTLDVAYAVSKTERFRINIFRQRGQTSLAARRINPKIPNVAQLNLPPIFSQLAMQEQGLVLIAGITGSGKSTTLAAMLEEVNEKRACHIITIEDPIEYLYQDKKAYINQREIGIDAESYAAAIRALMREDPDLILLGELRDRETFQAAVQAAETGHMVFSTIHASSASGAVTRLLELFPRESHENVRQALAANLKAIVYQKLVPSIQPGVVPVVEVLLVSAPVRKYLLEGRENELLGIIRAEKQAGMIDFNDMLVGLVEREVVHLREALAASPNPEEMRMRLRGVRNSGF